MAELISVTQQKSHLTHYSEKESRNEMQIRRAAVQSMHPGKERRTRLQMHMGILGIVLLSMFCTLLLLHSVSVSRPESIRIMSELWQPSRYLQSPVKTQNPTPFSHPASSLVGDIINIETPGRESLISFDSPLQHFMQIPSDYDPDIQSMWTCSDPDASKHGRRKKLIFIHVFKAAGSTFRVLFAQYALQCKAGYASAAGCSGLSQESVTTQDKWVNSFGNTKSTCALQLSVDRKGEMLGERRSITNSFLKAHADILIGHLPIGAHQSWMDEKENRTVDAQYICFFREPTHKYVSAILYLHPELSSGEIVNLVQQRVRDARSKGTYYEGYSAYLLSPEQKSVLYAKQTEGKKKPPLEYRIQLILQNMIDHHILIGIIESMSSSLELMLHVVDGTGEMTEIFQQVDTKSNTSKPEGDLLVANKSKLSTAAIIEELRNDAESFQDLQEYLKYDEAIYSFALELHNLQYERLQSSKSFKS
jgi:hypothetical protein